jgi:hypothetical protein
MLSKLRLSIAVMFISEIWHLNFGGDPVWPSVRAGVGPRLYLRPYHILPLAVLSMGCRMAVIAKYSITVDFTVQVSHIKLSWFLAGGRASAAAYGHIFGRIHAFWPEHGTDCAKDWEAPKDSVCIGFYTVQCAHFLACTVLQYYSMLQHATACYSALRALGK